MASICSRDRPIFEGVRANISDLPFERRTFTKIIQKFNVHPAITRTIGREIAYFSIQHHGGYEAKDAKISKSSVARLLGRAYSPIACTARTSSVLPDDIAISSTFFPGSCLNLALIYGCNEKQKQQIMHRIEAFNLAYNHPILLPGLLAELERIRLFDQVDSLLDNFTFRAWAERELDLDTNKAKLTSFLKLCFDSRELIDQMQSVKKQLAKMITEITKFGESLFQQPMNNSTVLEFERLKLAGNQISSRLDEILSEFDDKIDNCNMIIDNMSLTMQTIWNHFAREDNKVNLRLARSNTELSHEMKYDSSQMRSIALLTMVFLPLSTVASIFSTTLFNWNAPDGQSVVSAYIWIFVVISVGLTSITVGTWYLVTHRSKQSSHSLEFMMNDIV
ncbi:hypothetical protein F5884DRAFT_679762 [Xylogone sp. PMI_703]|nr:hypothetical protein F5884DRAFT_679762 [Xylogone sp. PMI_703]